MAVFSSARSRLRRYVVLLLIILGLTTLTVSTTGCSVLSAEKEQSEALYAQQLAAHLTVQGSAVYGAFWCPHCARQKELFGDSANAIPYVECDPSGNNAQPQLCQAKSLRGYPTWEINGTLYPGVRSLEELAALSNFSPP